MALTLFRLCGVFGALLFLVGGASLQLFGTNAPVAGWFAAGAVGIGAWAFADRKLLSTKLRGRSNRLQIASISLQALALLFVVGAYAIVDARLDTTWDLTGRGTHTLSSQTLSVLEGVKKPVQIKAFFPKDSQMGAKVANLVRLYQNETDLITFDWTAPLADPRAAAEYQIQADAVILEQDGRIQRLDADFDEDNLTRKLIQVQNDVEHEVCWSTGHGEAGADEDRQPDGYGAAVIALEQTNIQVENVLIATQGVPRSCEVLVIVRPKTDFQPYEREAVAAYLAEGGQVVVLVDPLAETPGFTGDLERFGIRVRNDAVFDDDPSVTVAERLGVLAMFDDHVVIHPTTASLTSAVVLPLARSMEAVERPGLVTRPLFRTSTQAWGETSYDNPNVQPDEGLDAIGELFLAMSTEVVQPATLEVIPHQPSEVVDPTQPTELEERAGRLVPEDFQPVPGGQILVVGDMDFASNQAITTAANRDFFLNIFAWMLEEEAQIGERATDIENLTLSEVGSAGLCMISIGAVPGAMVLMGLLMFIRRSRL